jgi:23S rRNA pseudouridine2605 synthase
MALERAAKGKKVVPKKKVPEFAQLKAPVKKKPSFGRRTFTSQAGTRRKRSGPS